jgi:hypothetical protein
MAETQPQVPYPNIYWAVPGQLLAGEHPGDVDDRTVEAQLCGLLEAGIRTFVDLTEEHETKGYSILLRCFAEERGLAVTYLRIPIPDRGVPSVGTMRCILDLLDRSLTDKHPAFVHCFAGIGRTGTVVGCYLQRHGLVTPGNVMARIAKLRIAMPVGREISPHTSGQVQMVERWGQGTCPTRAEALAAQSPPSSSSNFNLAHPRQINLQITLARQALPPAPANTAASVPSAGA